MPETEFDPRDLVDMTSPMEDLVGNVPTGTNEQRLQRTAELVSEYYRYLVDNHVPDDLIRELVLSWHNAYIHGLW